MVCGEKNVEAPTDRFVQETTVSRTLKGIVHTCPERLSESTIKRKAM